MKNKKGLGLIALLLIIVIIGTAYGTGTFKFAIDNPFDYCTWQPDLCFASCVEHGSTTGNYGTPVQCPTGADVHNCVVKNINYDAIGVNEVHVYASCSQSGWFGEWVCENYIRTTYVGDEIGRGQWLTGNLAGGGGATITLEHVRKALMRCGTAGCTGGGIVISSAQGCSWNPGTDNYVWEDGTTGAKSIPFGTGYAYVCSQHLVSCPSLCEDPLNCAVPS